MAIDKGFLRRVSLFETLDEAALDALSERLIERRFDRGQVVFTEEETGEYMYELLHRNAPIIEIPQAHHHLILDQPLAFIAAVRALLADWEHSEPRPRP